jgi:hypothetical protein
VIRHVLAQDDKPYIRALAKSLEWGAQILNKAGAISVPHPKS